MFKQNVHVLIQVTCAIAVPPVYLSGLKALQNSSWIEERIYGGPAIIKLLFMNHNALV